MEKHIIENLRKRLLEAASEIWYHGTPDVREIESEGGFTERNKSVEYVEDLNGYHKAQDLLRQARESGDMDKYHEILDTIPSYRKRYTYSAPIFLTNDSSVARSYADPSRSFDYQNAVEKVLSTSVNCGKTLTINAPGDRFRFIDVERVKKGFVNAGIPQEEIQVLIDKFCYHHTNKQGIKTDVVAAIAHFMRFECIDVVGVLDSYNGGSVRSTVKMVFNPKNIRILD